MNLQRGLLRAWVVVSAAWVLFIGVNDWAQLSEIFVDVEPPPGQGAVSLPPGPYACWAARHPDNPFGKFYPGMEGMSPAEVRRQCITYKLQVPMNALAPPLILLVFGYLVAWVVRGFRKGPTAP
jgi:hypothetical protein